MDIEQLRAETRRALEEANYEEEVDLSYIDELAEEMASRVEESESGLFTEGGLMWLHAAIFMGGPGGLVYGKVVDKLGDYLRCLSWSTGPFRWRTRSIVTSCRGTTQPIWKIELW